MISRKANFKLNLWKLLWGMVWALSEFTGIGLGRFAPWVFHQMIGSDVSVSKIK